jgi:nicotinate-nucleotide adenylyltransferase
LVLVRVGVLGGTFNPIHLGHLHVARACQRIFSLSQVHFVVATVPPHKPVENLIPFAHRYAMVCLATSGNPAFIPSLVELEPESSPFSIDTMDKLSRRIEREKGTLYFIAGGDSLFEVKSWRESEALLNSYNFIFVLRPGTGRVVPFDLLPEKVLNRVRDLRGMRASALKLRAAEEERAGGCRIYIVDLKAPDISATSIRGQAGLGKPIRGIPSTVREYIRKLHLYGER